MRLILTLFAVLVLAGGCAGADFNQASKNDLAGAIYGHGMIGKVPILVPVRNIPIN